jgi:hypothetical protein
MELKAIKNEFTGVWDVEGLEHWSETFKTMVNNLRSYKNFKFARYGDGEIYCIKGRHGNNCDNHIYFPDLGAALRQSIQEEPDYMTGIQPLSISHIPEDVVNYFSHFKKLYNADVLHNASITGDLKQFEKSMEGRYIILVGPAHLASFFNTCVHIVIPSVNCWLEYPHIKEQINFHLEGINNAVVILAASMMSEVLISDFEEVEHTFIDVGSVLDPYCGVKSRKYHHKLKCQ